MSDRIERELSLPRRSRGDLRDAVTSDGWLADEVEPTPGGDGKLLERRSGQEVVEEARAPERLAFWWAADGEPATRVELTLEADADADAERTRAAGRRDEAGWTCSTSRDPSAARNRRALLRPALIAA